MSIKLTIMKYGLAFMLFMSYGLMHGQNLTIKGKVTSDGQPLPGVNVLVKGTTKGTVTDFDGLYEIKAGGGEVLEFSFIGFKAKNVSVNGKTQIDVVLEENLSELDEVVIVGYGTQKKERSYWGGC